MFNQKIRSKNSNINESNEISHILLRIFPSYFLFYRFFKVSSDAMEISDICKQKRGNEETTKLSIAADGPTK